MGKTTKAVQKSLLLVTAAVFAMLPAIPQRVQASYNKSNLSFNASWSTIIRQLNQKESKGKNEEQTTIDVTAQD